ncbi:accessory gland protein Acp29AB-like [Drosophila elegans]|uniref:accessory gland protein Acp29AB-like n=1 Tax=Drosophila elegans TaxID=30023 RepID=UPI0007E89010|nr:accessory gland protein Acp29AB-like [Drosophila elegans]
MLVLAKALFSGLMIVMVYGSLAITTEGPISGDPLPELETQLDGCCFSALQRMLDHVAAHQTEWDACERSKLNDVQADQIRIESELSDIQAKLSSSGNWPESKSNVLNIPPNFEKIDSKYYYIEKSTRQNWYGASNFCRQMGAHLASIQNSMEQSRIEQHLVDREVYWLDTTDLATEGEFVHSSSGKKASFLNWGYGEPDNHQNMQHCIFLYNGYYYDSHCNTKSLFICQAGLEK